MHAISGKVAGLTRPFLEKTTTRACDSISPSLGSTYLMIPRSSKSGRGNRTRNAALAVFLENLPTTGANSRGAVARACMRAGRRTGWLRRLRAVRQSRHAPRRGSAGCPDAVPPSLSWPPLLAARFAAPGAAEHVHSLYFHGRFVPRLRGPSLRKPAFSRLALEYGPVHILRPHPRHLPPSTLSVLHGTSYAPRHFPRRWFARNNAALRAPVLGASMDFHPWWYAPLGNGAPGQSLFQLLESTIAPRFGDEQPPLLSPLLLAGINGPGRAAYRG